LSGSRQSAEATPPESFGSRLKRQRRASDLTQFELGEQFGVAQQTIGAWERGERPGREFLVRLASYIGLDSEQELISLLNSQEDLPDKPDTTGTEMAQTADTDAATMRLLARCFTAERISGSLPSEHAAAIYHNFTAYFMARADPPDAAAGPPSA
jgi:transcriptional regulator with XRE-family HTH domain